MAVNVSNEPTSTLLIPVCEMPPGSISQIRNQVKDQLLAIAQPELKIATKDLIIRDLRWVEDLQAYSVGTTAATINDWTFTTAGTATTGFITITGDKQMGNQRFVALYGVRDLRLTYGTQQAAATVLAAIPQAVSLVKIDVGGGTRAQWDLSKVEGTLVGELAGVSPSAVIIPQNVLFNIYFYKSLGVASVIARVVLMGMVVEPRGLVISP